MTEPEDTFLRIRRWIFSGSGITVSRERTSQQKVIHGPLFTALLTIGFKTPKGGLKKRTGAPVACWIARSVIFSSRKILPDGYQSNQGEWAKEWFPIKCPSAAIRLTSCSFSATFLPIQKKRAWILYLFSNSRMAGVLVECGPSSKVRHTCFSNFGSLQRTPLWWNPLQGRKAKTNDTER